MNILITGVGGPAGSSLARQLHGRGHQVTGADMQLVEADCLADFVQVPAAREDNYVQMLREIILDRGIDLVIPTVSEELPIVAAQRNRELIEGAGAAMLVSSEASIGIADDKYYTMLTLSSDQVPVPDFIRGDLYGKPGCARFLPFEEVILKPRVSRGGRGVRLVQAAQLLDGSQDLTSNDLIQRFAPGREFAPMLFRNPASGEVEVCVVVEKTELREGRIGNAVSVQRAQPDATTAHVAQVATAAVLSLDLVGPVDLDIRLTAQGQPVVLEANARFGANSAWAPELVEALLRCAGSRIPGTAGHR